VKEKAVKEAKPVKEKAEKKTKKEVAPSAPVPVEISAELEEEEEEEIQTRQFLFNGVTYLLDESTSNIYDITTHEQIGNFDKNAQTIILL
jgi:hypothetical protein